MRKQKKKKKENINDYDDVEYNKVEEKKGTKGTEVETR